VYKCQIKEATGMVIDLLHAAFNWLLVAIHVDIFIRVRISISASLYAAAAVSYENENRVVF
jgi:hypothetical protein